jgi:tripartite-type tricarboxylate transporter receptor subunit TctC
MPIDRRSAIRLLAAPALLGSLAVFPSSARAQPYPSKPIRIIVPYPAGGPYDGIPRIIAQWISAQQGWSIDTRSSPRTWAGRGLST